MKDEARSVIGIGALLQVAVLIMTGGATPGADPRAKVGEGVVVGRAENGVAAFKGIPYAAPPTGPLRWRPPRPPAVWKEPGDAGRFGAICIQPPPDGDPGVGRPPMSEDCLTLNVWTPEQRAGPLSVMVWIHGGGFNTGSGSAALYDGANLTRRGVVVVTLNYRLGRLGFFDHPALAAERPAGEAAGNYGLMDMVAALAWVRANIASFGGDPDRVTVCGQSAGGAAVMRLMISAPARGLFHGAVVQSGLGRDEGTPLDRPGAGGAPSARDRGAAFAAGLGLGPDVSGAALRALDAEALLQPAPGFYDGDLLLIDGGLVAEDVETAFAAGRQAPVPLIIGSNSAEFGGMKPSGLKPCRAFEAALRAGERAALISAYGGADGYDAHVVNDLVFSEPARHIARLHARAGNPTFLYRFDVAPAGLRTAPGGGVLHGSERPYVFDNLAAAPIREHRLAATMADYWAAFVRSGDPNGDGRPHWPDARHAEDRLLAFENEGPVSGPAPFADRLDLIEACQDRLARERDRVSRSASSCP